jgi:hypothetical protein
LIQCVQRPHGQGDLSPSLQKLASQGQEVLTGTKPTASGFALRPCPTLAEERVPAAFIVTTCSTLGNTKHALGGGELAWNGKLSQGFPSAAALPAGLVHVYCSWPTMSFQLQVFFMTQLGREDDGKES